MFEMNSSNESKVIGRIVEAFTGKYMLFFSFFFFLKPKNVKTNV